MHTDPHSRSTVGTGRLRRALFMTAVAAVAVAALPVTSAGAARSTTASAPATRVGYSGHAFATYVTALGTVRSGPSAVSALGCGPPAGLTTGNSTAAVDASPLLTGSTLATTGSTNAAPLRTATTATAQTVNLAGGLVSATAVKAVSISFHDSRGYSTSATGTSLASLSILHVPVPVLANPAPNTTIAVPGVGSLVLNEQHTTVTATSATKTVIAMHLSVTLGANAGANIIVGYAYSAITDPTTGFVSGQAYGTQAQLGTLLGSGPSFLVNLPCGGTNNQLRTNTGVGVTVPTFLTAGAVTNTARGSSSATLASGQTTSTVAGANLINGLVQATLIKADAHATRVNGVTTLSDTGTTFGSISLSGHPLINIQPNTVIEVPGIGTLYLRREIRTANSIEIRMIELVTKANPFGLPVGIDLRVAVASVGAR